MITMSLRKYRLKPFLGERVRRVNQAFTLIELLVVISIIALLVSILLPALNNARMLAREMICKTNLRSLYLGMYLYAEDHKGLALKFKGYDDGPYVPSNGGQDVWYTYLAFQGFANNNTPNPTGLGRLHRARYIESGESFYCPAVNGIRWRFDGYSDSETVWGDEFPQSELPPINDKEPRIRINYIYWHYWEKRIDKFKDFTQDLPVIFDYPYHSTEHRTDPIRISHMVASTNEPKGFNVLWGDGHVTMVEGNPDIFADDMWKDRLNNYAYWIELMYRFMGYPPMTPQDRIAGW